MADNIRIGWIGTGRHGAFHGRTSLDRRLAPDDLQPHQGQGPSRCFPKGARWADSPRDVAAASDLVFSIVGYPRDVEEVMLGEQGRRWHGLAQGGILCDMTTSSPALARRIAEAAAASGCAALDAPVTGGDVGAREGRLSIFVGGEAATFKRAEPCLAAMGQRLLHCGPAGSGQKAKLANQVAVAGVMFSVCESMLFARQAGLDVSQWLDLVMTGAARAARPWPISAPASCNVIMRPVSILSTLSRTWACALRNAAACNWCCRA